MSGATPRAGGRRGPPSVHPHLDLVIDEEEIPLRAEPAQPRQVVGGWIRTPFSLDGLDEDGTGGAVDGSRHRIHIVELHVAEAVHQGFEPVVDLLLTVAERVAMVDHGRSPSW